MSKILACLDTSPYAQSVCDLASWASRRLDLPVDVLHILQRNSAVAKRNDLTGAIGLGVKSELLEELTQIEEAESRIAIQAGRALLKAANEYIRNGGATDVTSVHRHGGIVETILQFEEDSTLLIMGKRGVSAQFARAHLGSKIERVLRSSKKPLLVAPETVGAITRVVVAYDGSTYARRALELAISSPLFRDLELHVVVAGADNKHNQDELDTIRKQADTAGHSATVSLLNGAPEAVIPAYVTDHPDSILVMGAYGHSPLRNLIVGSTTTAMIRVVDRPILLIR